MQTELLETFLDLIETSSFNRTAERLGITQSTVSGRIQVLENALGRKLFSRSRAGTRPTAAGQRFAEHARAMRHEWNEARRSVQSTGDYARSIRIGMQNDLAATHAGEWIAEFRKAHPQTSFYLEPDYSNQMCADLLAGELDVAVIFTPKHIPDLHYENVGEIRYRLVSTHASRVAEIDAERYIFANYSPAFDRAHRQLMPDFTNAAVASGQNAAVCNLLTTLGGTAFILEESAAEMIPAGLCRYVEDTIPIPQPVYFAVHLRNRHSHVHKKMLAIVQGYFATAK
jgi:LysR family transcriptional regulator, flagellar master operon regulator